MSGLIGVLRYSSYRSGNIEQEECGIMKYISRSETEVKENINAVDQLTGCNALHLAIQNVFVNVANYLIKEGININVNTINGTTMLHYAVMSGHIEIVKMCIKSGNNVNAMNNYNETPLYCAIIYGYIGIVKLLIKKGANVNYVVNGITSLDNVFNVICFSYRYGDCIPQYYIKILKILLNEMMYA